MRSSSLLIVSSLCILASCTLAPLQCFLSFSDYTKTYEFPFSREELKDRIIEAYSYDESLLLKNLGKTVIENEEVNKTYRTSVTVWLDKSNWDKFRLRIRRETPDTLNLVIGKHLSRKQIRLQAIVQGDANRSTLTIHGFKYQQRRPCKKDKEYYLLTLSEKIEKKFISKLKG
jgi:hypothetical protein